MATLLGEWGFLDNLNDTSGNDHTATASGFTPAYEDGPTPGTRAIVLTGSQACVDYGNTGLEPAAATGGIVTMAWVKLNDTHDSDTEIIARLRGEDSTRHAIRNTANGVSYMARWRSRLEYPPFGTTVASLADQNWHHVALVDGDERWDLYVDGVSVAGGGGTTGSLESWQPAYTWLTGYNADAQNQAPAIDMSVTAVRIFSGSMTTQEVNEWMGTAVVEGEQLYPPIITSTVPDLTEITVNWTSVPGVAGYRLLVDNVEHTSAGLITETVYTVTNLTQGQVYEFAVIAEDAEQNQSDPSTAVTERASMIVTSTQCVVTNVDDDSTSTISEPSLAFLPGGSPGDPDLGQRSNGRSGESFWWTRTDPPRDPVYPYLGPWSDGMTIRKESGDLIRVVEWVRGVDAWRETDLEDDGDTVTVDHSDLTMNAGSGPVGGDKLNCTLVEHGDGVDGWTARIWNYYPEEEVATTPRVWDGDDLSSGELTTSSAGAGDDAFTQVNGGWQIVGGDPTTITSSPVSNRTVVWANLTLTECATRHYYHTTALPESEATIMRYMDGSTEALRLQVRPNGLVLVRDATGNRGQTAAGAFLPNTTYRIECVYPVDTDPTVTFYVGESLTPAFTINASAGTWTAPNAIWFGSDGGDGLKGGYHTMRNFELSDTASQIGPWGTPPAPSGTAIYRISGGQLIPMNVTML